MSEVLGGGTASIGVSATSDMEAKMSPVVEYINLINKLLSMPFSEWGQYDKEAEKLVVPLKDCRVYFWEKHCAERKKWKEAEDMRMQIRAKLEQNKKLVYLFRNWVMSNNLPH